MLSHILFFGVLILQVLTTSVTTENSVVLSTDDKISSKIEGVSTDVLLKTNSYSDGSKRKTEFTTESSHVQSFFLWTNEYNGGAEKEILYPWNSSTIKLSHFKPRQTFIVVHGFLGNGLEPWMLKLKDKLLKLLSCNFISFTWPAGSSIIDYHSVVAKVPFVAGELATLIETLMNIKGLRLKYLHLIGHSLGAHISGFAGKQFQDKLHRITGLDPAGPSFRDVPSTHRLDKNDADFVDIIHTNGCSSVVYIWECFGIDKSIGHADFWPNGGKYQPACREKSHRRGFTFSASVNGEIGCDHMISHEYYVESLSYSIKSTYFLARPCEHWQDFMEGNCSCGSRSQYMGYNVNMRLKGVYFLATNRTSPYAEQDVQCHPGATNIVRLIILSVAGIIVSVVAVVFAYVILMWQINSRNTGTGADGEVIIDSRENEATQPMMTDSEEQLVAETSRNNVCVS